MSHAKELYDWQQRLATFCPNLHATHRTWLALASYGITLAQSALLNTVVLRLALALGSSFNAVRQRLRKLYRPAIAADGGDGSFAYTTCFAPLLRWATAGFSDHRLVLVIDPTCLGDRFVILTVSVVFQACAVPVAWQVQRADQSGSWNEQWKRLLGLLRQALTEDWQVLVLCDRGLESQTLFESITALGWHPLMRLTKRGHFRPDGWNKGWPLGRFAAHEGCRWMGHGLAWPTRACQPGTLLACWEQGQAEPWLLLTDLAVDQARAIWYAWRSWIEQGFRDLKSDGWQLAKTRMQDAERVARWWTAAALATLWVLESGQEAQRLEVPATRTHAGRQSGAVTSLFALGLAFLATHLGHGGVRRMHRLPQPQWPLAPQESDTLKEEDWIAEHQTVPL